MDISWNCKRLKWLNYLAAQKKKLIDKTKIGENVLSLFVVLVVLVQLIQ